MKRYGYTEAHRRGAGQHYSTDLTDAEWALFADLFERSEGGRGAPARYDRRQLINACCYVLRTGCAWRLLPLSFAPWQAVCWSPKTDAAVVSCTRFKQAAARLKGSVSRGSTAGNPITQGALASAR